MIGRSEGGEIPVSALEGSTPEGSERLAVARDQLRRRGLLEAGGLVLTETGRDVCARLVRARRERLTELVSDWDSESPEVDAMIERLSRELGRGQPSPQPA